MKKITAIIALALLATTTPVLAGSLVGEVRLGDIRGGHDKSTEYKFEYTDAAAGFLYGAELQVRQKANEGDLKSKLSVRGGVDIPEVFGFRPVVFGELGRGLEAGNNGYFWGINGGISRTVYGPVSVNVGARRRQNFDFVQGEKFVEDRGNVGVRYSVSKDTALGVQYYNYIGGMFGGNVNRQEVGIQLVRSF